MEYVASRWLVLYWRHKVGSPWSQAWSLELNDVDAETCALLADGVDPEPVLTIIDKIMVVSPGASCLNHFS